MRLREGDAETAAADAGAALGRRLASLSFWLTGALVLAIAARREVALAAAVAAELIGMPVLFVVVVIVIPTVIVVRMPATWLRAGALLAGWDAGLGVSVSATLLAAFALGAAPMLVP